MATSGTCYSSQYNNRGIVFVWERTGYSSENSTTDIYWELRGTGSHSGYYASGNFRVNIAGIGDVYSSSARINLYDGTLIASGRNTIQMNSDGTGSFSVYIEAGIYYIAVNVSGSTTFTLDTIPRYATITSFSVSKRDETSVTVTWGADVACDKIWYSINDGSWVETSGYPTFNITGLTANTTYNFKLRVRRTDSQLTTDSSTYAQTTYAYPYISSAPNFTIGNTLSIGIYNPLKRSCVVYVKNTAGTEKGGDTTTGTGISGYNNSSCVDFWYAGIPNSTSGQYKVRLVVSALSRDTTVNGGTYTINQSESKPTFTDWEYQDTNATTVALTNNNQIVIKGYSQIKGIISTTNKATAKYSATMKSYKLTIGSKSSNSATYSSSSSVETSPSIIAETNVMTLYATDSRDNSTSVIKTATTYKEYFNIGITSVSVARTQKVNKETMLTLNGTIWNNSFGSVTNAINSISVSYRLAGSTGSYTTITGVSTPTLSGNTFSLSQTIRGDEGADGFSIENSFEIKVVISDKLSSATKTTILGNGIPNLAIHKDGAAINQPYDTDLGGDLQVAQIRGNKSGGWISSRDKATIRNSLKYTGASSTFVPVSSVDTRDGNWCVGAYQTTTTEYEELDFVYTTDEDYEAGTNTATKIKLPNKEGVLPITKQLYYNSSGSSGTITLSESAANFSNLEIIYKTNRTLREGGSTYAWENSMMVSTTGSHFTLNGILLSSDRTSIKGSSTIYDFSGTTFTPVFSGQWEIYNTGVIGFNENNTVYIKQVIGYR